MADVMMVIGMFAVLLGLASMLVAISYSLYRESNADAKCLADEVSDLADENRRLRDENWLLRELVGMDEEDCDG